MDGRTETPRARVAHLYFWRVTLEIRVISKIEIWYVKKVKTKSNKLNKNLIECTKKNLDFTPFYAQTRRSTRTRVFAV